jgi:hypothetical protein
MDEVVELVVVIPTSPSSSKMESECKSYNYFRIDVFSQAGNFAKSFFSSCGATRSRGAEILWGGRNSAPEQEILPPGPEIPG